MIRRLSSVLIGLAVLAGCGGSSAGSTPEVLTPPEIEPLPVEISSDIPDPTSEATPTSEPPTLETEEPVTQEVVTEEPATDEPAVDSGPFTAVTVFDFADPEGLFTAQVGPGPDADTLWIVAGDSAVIYSADDSILDSVEDDETIVGVDEQGRLWFSSVDGELVAYVGEKGGITRFGAAEGWEPVPGISTHLEVPRIDSRGWTWISTPADLRVLRDGRWETITPPDMPVVPGSDADPLVSSFSLAVIGDQVWAGHCYFAPPGVTFNSEGLRFFDGENWNTTPISDGCVRDIRQDGAGNIWVGQNDSLWRRDAVSGEWSNQPLPEAVDATFVYLEEFLLGSNGDLWPVVALCGGASCFGSFNLYHAYSDGALALVAQSLFAPVNRWYQFQLVDGRSLLLWDGQFNLVEGDQLTPLVDAQIVDAFQDDSGQIWALAWTELGLELWLMPGS